MKLHLFQKSLWTIVAVACVHGLMAPALGGQIKYSWSGQLVPNSSDPWQLGDGGKPFTLDVVIPLDAADRQHVNVEFAAFDGDSARLTLDGQEVMYVGGANLDFTDNWGGLFDIVSFGGNFQRLGETIEIGSSVFLPLPTFQFFRTLEPPPFFQSTSEGIGGVCCGGAYAAVVLAGAFVSVVPEGNSMTNLALGGVIVAFSFQTRLRRTRSNA